MQGRLLMVSLALVGRGGRTGTVCWAILALAVSAGCQRSVVPNSQTWVGQRVFVKSGTVLRPRNAAADGKRSENAASGGSGRLGSIYQVQRDGGSWLGIQDESSGTAGWAPAESVIPYDRADELERLEKAEAK
jgi:hypothetical protein